MTYSQVVPPSFRMEICGREFLLSAPTLADLSAVADYYRKRNPSRLLDTLKAIKESGVGPEIAAVMIREHDRKQAEAESIGPAEAMGLIATNPGYFSYLVWVIVERMHPGTLRLEQVLIAFADRFVSDKMRFAEELKQVMEVAGFFFTARNLAAGIASEKKVASEQILNSSFGDGANPLKPVASDNQPANSADLLLANS